MKEITNGELLLLQDTLFRMKEELESIDDYDYVVTSGVEEGIAECLVIVNSLLDANV